MVEGGSEVQKWAEGRNVEMVPVIMGYPIWSKVSTCNSITNLFPNFSKTSTKKVIPSLKFVRSIFL